MARGQKKEKKELTPEERLQNALVPKVEWPYELPEGWKWVYLGGVCKVLNGFAFKSKQYVSSGIRIIRIANVQEGYIEDNKPVYYPLKAQRELADYMLSAGDLLLSLTGNVGRAAILTEDLLPAALNQRVACIRPIINDINIKYLFYYLDRQEFRDACIKNSKGSAQLNMSTGWLKQQAVPICPIEKQNQLVDFLDNEFHYLDEAKDQIQSVIDSSEERKQSILHKAFSGKLTEKWRKKQGISEKTWQKRKLKDACNGLKYGTSSKSDKEGAVPVIRMGNLQHGEIDWGNLVYSNNEEDNEKYSLKPGDVLFNRTNSPEWVGKTSIYRGERPAIYAGYLVKLDYKSELLSGEYLNFIMNSPEAKTYCNAVKTDGVNQSNISAKKIGEFIIPIPSIDEQEEIVRLLNSFIEKEDEIENAAEQIMSNVEDNKKSLLSKAFRGELHL